MSDLDRNPADRFSHAEAQFMKHCHIVCVFMSVCPFYTPPLKKVRGIMLYPPKKKLRLSVRPSVCPSVRPSVRPSVCPSVSVSFPGSILSIY